MVYIKQTICYKKYVSFELSYYVSVELYYMQLLL